MRVVLRPDNHAGLTAAEMAVAADRLESKVTALRESGRPSAGKDADRLAGDIPVWRAAAIQMREASTEGRWSIDWEATDLREVDPLVVAVREYGARNSKKDMSTIQKAHDALCELGAKCMEEKGEVEEPEGEMPEVRESVVYVDGSPVEVRFAESAGFGGLMTLREAAAEFNDDAREVWITPIRPGFGNKRDGFYYPVETVREATLSGAFDGVKMFANHPTKSSEKELPERSVTDWVGVIKETRWDESRQVPRARVKVLDDSVYSKWKAAPEHVAFSVLGAGVARPGRVNGQTARIVESVKGIRSVDWVTQAGAGGGIDFRESAAEEFDMDLKNITPAQFREALRERPDLLAVLAEADEPEDTDEDTAPEPEPEPETETEAAGIPAPDGYVSRDEYEALAARLDAAEARDVREAYVEGQRVASAIVDDVLEDSTLTRAAKDYLRGVFREASIGAGFDYATEDELREAVDGEVDKLSAVIGRSRVSPVRGLGSESVDEPRPTSLRESKELSLFERLTRSDALPSSIAENGTLAGAPSESDAGRRVEARMAARGL